MTENVSRNQTPIAAPSGLAIFEHLNTTLKSSEEAKRHLSSEIQRYAAAYAKLKAAYEKLKAAHEGQTIELSSVKSDKINLTETNRRQAAVIQSYESQIQLFSAEVVRSDAHLLDCNSLIAPVFGLDEFDGQKGPVMDLSLTQSINEYGAVEPAQDNLFALSLPEEVASVFQEEGDSLITDADLNLDMDAIARDIGADSDKEKAA
jgi:hypothetical protein